MARILTACLVCICFMLEAQNTRGQMKPLFNGRNFEGWYSFLKSSGKNSDPGRVFTIENGLLHISGKDFGYICTERQFTDFHLFAEFKWGTQKYPPRDADSTRRDNGILFNIPMDAPDKIWPKGIECQVQEGDVGDFWMVDSVTIVVDAARTVPKDYFRVAKKKNAEKPSGEWNTVEIISRKGHIRYLVNGTLVNEADAPSVTTGKISIQSEGAEIYYRKIDIAAYK